jgi:hypothetical protein
MAARDIAQPGGLRVEDSRYECYVTFQYLTTFRLHHRAEQVNTIKDIISFYFENHKTETQRVGKMIRFLNVKSAGK